MQKRYYFLVAATIVFVNQEDEPNQITVNAILENRQMELTVSSIGRAQQTAQMVFFKRFPDSPVQVTDVIINNLVYMGYMTQKEFHDVGASSQDQDLEISVN